MSEVSLLDGGGGGSRREIQVKVGKELVRDELDALNQFRSSPVDRLHYWMLKKLGDAILGLFEYREKPEDWKRAKKFTIF